MAVTQETIDRAADAAQELIDAADYLKTELDKGNGVYESHYLDPMMTAHGVLCELASRQTHAHETLKRQEIEIALLCDALRAIVARGGNLSDDHLISKTGPNDADARGLMYVDSRRIAQAFLERHDTLDKATAPDEGE